MVAGHRTEAILSVALVATLISPHLQKLTLWEEIFAGLKIANQWLKKIRR